MKIWFSPDLFNQLAITLAEYRWKLLLWSVLAFVLFSILQLQVSQNTPKILIGLVIFILFSALQALVVAAFIFFFQVLQSVRPQNQQWYRFYRTIEWCEALLFGFILPLPAILLVYTLILI